jgi:hypothetical protein
LFRCGVRRRAEPPSRLIALTGVLLFVSVAFASPTASGLTVSIAQFRLAAEPESEVAGSFVVLNDEPRSVDFTLLVVDWDEDSDGVLRTMPSGRVERSCAMWLEVDTRAFRLTPSEERAVAFTVRVPPHVSGTYWTGLTIRASSTGGVATESLIRIFVDVPSAPLRAAVVSLEVLTLSPLRVVARVVNLEIACLYEVQGLVTVERSEGDVASCALSPFRLLPQHARDVEGVASWGLESAGTYIVRLVFDYGADALVAGQVVVRVP